MNTCWRNEDVFLCMLANHSLFPVQLHQQAKARRRANWLTSSDRHGLLFCITCIFPYSAVHFLRFLRFTALNRHERFTLATFSRSPLCFHQTLEHKMGMFNINYMRFFLNPETEDESFLPCYHSDNRDDFYSSLILLLWNTSFLTRVTR